MMEDEAVRPRVKERPMSRLIIADSRQDLGHLAHHMSSLMHKILQSGFSTVECSSGWAPAVDICEAPEEYEIIVDLAGVRRENIEVYTEHGTLTLSGWREDPTPRHKVAMHQMEIEQGQFCRRLQLPADADEESVAARYRDGFLHVQVAKRRDPAT
jgi:HSP20 family molecular chaperone IbpA